VTDELLSDDAFSAPQGKESNSEPELLSDEHFAAPTEGKTETKSEGKGILSNNNDGWVSGAAKGTATGAIKGGIAGTVGVPAMIRDMNNAVLDFGYDKASKYILGHDEEQRKREQENRDRLRKDIGVQSLLPNTEQIYKSTVEPVAGEYKPESGAGRAAMGAVEAVTMGGNPVKSIPKLVDTARREGPGAAKAIGEYLGSNSVKQVAKDSLGAAGRTLKDNGINALSGAGSTATYDLTGNPYLAFAAGIAPGGAARLASMAGKGIPPISKTDRERQAVRDLDKFSSDPQALREKIWPKEGPTQDEIIPGAPLTMGQRYGDRGLLELERAMEASEGAKTASGESVKHFNELAGQRNEAHRNAVAGLRTEGADALDVPRHVDSHYDRIMNEAEQEHQRLLQKSEELSSRLGEGRDASAIGEDLRSSLEAAKKAESEKLDRLYKTVDPDKSLHLSTNPVQEASTSILTNKSEYSTALSPIEKEIYEQAASMPNVLKLDDIRNFDSKLSEAMSDARLSGRRQELARLTQLKISIKDAINNAVQHQSAWEQQAVKRGVLKPEDTLEHRLKVYGAETERAVGEDASASARKSVVGAEEPTGEGNVPPEMRAGSEGSRRPNGSEGDQRLQGEGSSAGRVEFDPKSEGVGSKASQEQSQPNKTESGAARPNMTKEAAERLAVANKANEKFQTTYNEGPVGAALETNGFAKQYNTGHSSVPAKAVVAGDKGYETAKTFLNAAKQDPQAVTAMQDQVLNRLRATVGINGRIDPNKLAKWKQNFSGTLRAIDEHVPGFSSTFDDAAKAETAFRDFAVKTKQTQAELKKNPLNRFFGLKTGTDVENAVGSMMTSGKVGDAKTVIEHFKKNAPESLDALRTSFIDWLTRKKSNTGVGANTDTHILSYDKLNTMLRDNHEALSALFTPQQMEVLRNVRKSMQYADRSNWTRIAGSPGTAKDKAAIDAFLKKSGDQLDKPLHWILIDHAMGGGMSLASLFGAAKVHTHLNAWSAGKSEQILRRMLTDPSFARQMMMKHPNVAPKDMPTLIDKLLVNAGMTETERQDRPKRAAGGRMSRKAMTADQLIRGLEMARNQQKKNTETILDKPDEAVVRALSIANEQI